MGPGGGKKEEVTNGRRSFEPGTVPNVRPTSPIEHTVLHGCRRGCARVCRIPRNSSGHKRPAIHRRLVNLPVSVTAASRREAANQFTPASRDLRVRKRCPCASRWFRLLSDRRPTNGISGPCPVRQQADGATCDLISGESPPGVPRDGALARMSLAARPFFSSATIRRRIREIA